MRSTMNVSLPKELKQWVDEQVRVGGYGTASEYLRDILRRAREREVRRQFEEELVRRVQEGASVVMDDADFASIRKAARTHATKGSRKKR